jgi:hypothetical protein
VTAQLLAGDPEQQRPVHLLPGRRCLLRVRAAPLWPLWPLWIGVGGKPIQPLVQLA